MISFAFYFLSITHRLGYFWMSIYQKLYKWSRILDCVPRLHNMLFAFLTIIILSMLCICEMCSNINRFEFEMLFYYDAIYFSQLFIFGWKEKFSNMIFLQTNADRRKKWFRQIFDIFFHLDFSDKYGARSIKIFTFSHIETYRYLFHMCFVDIEPNSFSNLNYL